MMTTRRRPDLYHQASGRSEDQIPSTTTSTTLNRPKPFEMTTGPEASSSEFEGLVTPESYPELCEVGTNSVDECSSIAPTQTKLAATTNLAKCICGAGSFALPHVFLQQGLLGGTLALTLCGGLAAVTMNSLSESRLEFGRSTRTMPNDDNNATIPTATIPTSYVQLAQAVLGKPAAQLVFALTLSAAIGVCSTYLVFIAQTLTSLASDAESTNLVRTLLPDTPQFTFELGTALMLIPLCLIRDYSIFAFTSALGVAAVVGGMMVTLASGVLVDPGWDAALANLPTLKLWPESLAVAFGTSFGTIAYLFCINFLTFPIMSSMQEPKQYGSAVNTAVAGVWFVNVIFAIGCLAFYGDATQDLVLGNLGNGPYLSALKLFLCVDLLFTYPIVFSSGRQILENALLSEQLLQSGDDTPYAPPRVLIVSGAVAATLALAQIGGFGAVANLVGGVAQGTLAFILPPIIAVTLARRRGDSTLSSEAGLLLVGSFGAVVVSCVTYFTIQSMIPL